MKRQKRLTKKERKAANPLHKPGPNVKQGGDHIHCIACGRHLHAEEFASSPVSATWITCDHGSQFPSCVTCMQESERRVAQHDRSGNAVQVAGAWH